MDFFGGRGLQLLEEVSPEMSRGILKKNFILLICRTMVVKVLDLISCWISCWEDHWPISPKFPMGGSFTTDQSISVERYLSAVWEWLYLNFYLKPSG